MTLLAASDQDLAPALDPEGLEGLLELVDEGDMSFLEDLYGSFLDSIPAALAAATGFLDAGDLESVGREAHSLKGASANVAALPLSDLCREVEDAARDGNAAGVREGLAAIAEEARRVRMAVANSLPSLSLA